MFTLTSAAALQIQQTASTSGAQDMALRVAARVDTDGSLLYGMGFDDAKDEDMKLDLEGVAVVIADESRDLLAGIVLDYVELNPGEFNFIFRDTHASSCGSDPASPRSGGCGGGGSCGGGGCGGSGASH